MEFFDAQRFSLVLIVSLVVLSSPHTGIDARPAPNFGERRLLILSENVDQPLGRRLLNLSDNTVDPFEEGFNHHRRLLNLTDPHRRLLDLSESTAGARRLLNLTDPHRRLLDLSESTAGARRLLNLSDNTADPFEEEFGHHRRLLNLSDNTADPFEEEFGHRRRLLNLTENTASETEELLHRRLPLNLSENSVELDAMPQSLFPSQGNKIHKVLKAEGYQEYTFSADGKWTLLNASALLSTFEGEEVGEHYFLPVKDSLGGQPTWKSFSPQSVLTAAPATEVTVSPESISWLLLSTTESSGSSSEFADVTFVQRFYTESGLPPSDSYIGYAGEIFKSPYSAIYFFYKRVDL